MGKLEKFVIELCRSGLILSGLSAVVCFGGLLVPLYGWAGSLAIAVFFLACGAICRWAEKEIKATEVPVGTLRFMAPLLVVANFTLVCFLALSASVFI